MTSRVSPEDQNVTFVELFFDLVFVFSVTQTVSLFGHGIAWVSVAKVVLIFWLVWWAWTQFTWALNAADTTHHGVQIGTLVATAIAFIMAVTLPDAFHGRALWFAIPYVVVRSVGLGLYSWVASIDPAQHAAVQRFTVASIGGLLAVIVGAVLGGTAQYWLWGLTIALDVVAALIGGRTEGWNLHPDHFAERHGLFVIIALGETLIVAAVGLSGATWTADLFIVAVLAVAVTCGMWWIYFTRAKPALDRSLASTRGTERSEMARDVYSLAHFPMLCGIIAYAVAVHDAVAHPAEPLQVQARLALGLALLLFAGGMVVAMVRASGRFLWPRLVVAVAAMLAIGLASSWPPQVSLAVALFATVIIAAVEKRTLAVAVAEGLGDR